MTANRASVLDPLAGLLLQFGRCGTVARFLVDLLACSGIPARLLTAGCHTAAEAWCEGRWVLVDASLFPPGVIPRDDAENPIGIEQAVACPVWLDRTPSYINYHHQYVQAFLEEYPETADEIGHYLRAPLLPSSAYFGGEFYRGRPPGQIERLSKVGSLKEWNADEHFGWLFGHEREIIQGPVLPTRQRPEQVWQIERDGTFLVWKRPFVADPGMSVRYRLVISGNSRGWDYEALPIGCHFKVKGQSLRVSEPRVPIEQVERLGRYLTIVTEVEVWEGEPIFYLPSSEFDLDRICCGSDCASHASSVKSA